MKIELDGAASDLVETGHERTLRIEYFEQASGTQPAELFEDGVPPRLAGKLARFSQAAAESGISLGGGYFEKCHSHSDLYEIRARLGNDLGREFCLIDGDRLVLLSGVLKRVGEPTPSKAFEEALAYSDEYKRTRKVSPIESDGV
ncbi:hypothetical protein EPN44_10905 [bacterium]|nr:MAG: hypothetical protein EPN44_10905 [bacterium]